MIESQKTLYCNWFKNIELMNSKIYDTYGLKEDYTDRIIKVIELKKAFLIGYAMLAKKWQNIFGNHDYEVKNKYRKFYINFPFYNKFSKEEIDNVLSLLKNLRNINAHVHAYIGNSYKISEILKNSFKDISIKIFDGNGMNYKFIIEGVNQAFYYEKNEQITVFGQYLLLITFLIQHERETLTNYICALNRKFKGNIIKVISPAHYKSPKYFKSRTDTYNSLSGEADVITRFYDRYMIEGLVNLSFKMEKRIIEENNLLIVKEGFTSFSDLLARVNLPKNITDYLNFLRKISAHGYILGEILEGREISVCDILDKLFELYDYFLVNTIYAELTSDIKMFIFSIVSGKYLSIYNQDKKAKLQYKSSLPIGVYNKKIYGDYGIKNTCEKLLLKNKLTVTTEVEYKIYEKFGAEIELYGQTEDIKIEMKNFLGAEYYRTKASEKIEIIAYNFDSRLTQLQIDNFKSIKDEVVILKNNSWKIDFLSINKNNQIIKWREKCEINTPYASLTNYIAEYENPVVYDKKI